MVHRTFPFRLHAILDQAYDLDVHGESRIISWTPNGKSFKIHNVQEFTKHILPKYFPKQSQYKSFKRQLQYYGFSNYGWEHFGHPFFLRRQRDLVANLRHKKSAARNQESVEHATLPPSKNPLEVMLKDTVTETRKAGDSLVKKKVESVPSPTFGVTPPVANPPMNLHSDLFPLTSPTSNIHIPLNEQRLMGLAVNATVAACLPKPRLHQAPNHLLMVNKYLNQQSDSQDLICRSNRLAELELRLALANRLQVPNMFL